MRALVLFLSISTLTACRADEYAPCNACSEGRAIGGGVEGCVCTYYCNGDADCPTPGTGDATPQCQSLGDVVQNGHTAACVLPCDGSTTCPNSMFCYQGECWGSP